MKHDDVKIDMSAANDKWSVKAAKPLVSDDWKVAGSVMVEGKPNASMKGEMNFDVNSPEMSGARVNMNVSIITFLVSKACAEAS